MHLAGWNGLQIVPDAHLKRRRPNIDREVRQLTGLSRQMAPDGRDPGLNECESGPNQLASILFRPTEEVGMAKAGAEPRAVLLGVTV